MRARGEWEKQCRRRICRLTVCDSGAEGDSFLLSRCREGCTLCAARVSLCALALVAWLDTACWVDPLLCDVANDVADDVADDVYGGSFRSLFRPA